MTLSLWSPSGAGHRLQWPRGDVSGPKAIDEEATTRQPHEVKRREPVARDDAASGSARLRRAIGLSWADGQYR